MYTNEKYEAFLKASDEIELGDNKVLLIQIKEFYKKISSKFENSTARYKNAVTAILDQFPISVKSGLNEKQSFLINKKVVSTIEELIVALKEYIAKFESIDYLEFLSEAKRNVVFVGPNGCGKTTLLRKLKKDTEGASIQYFPADRVLLVGENFNPKRAYDAFIKDLNENYNHSTFNYKEGTKTITFDDVKNEVSEETSGSDLDCSSAPKARRPCGAPCFSLYLCMNYCSRK